MAINPELQDYRDKLRCSVQNIDDIFDQCLCEAKKVMTPEGIEAWLDAASRVCGLGRGKELVLILLEDMPEIVRLTDENIIQDVTDMAETLSSRLLGPAINPFLTTLPAVCRRLEDSKMLRDWLQLVAQMADEAKEGLVPLLGRIVYLLNQLSIGGLKNWINYGIRAYQEQPHRLGDFFSLQAADAHAMLQRERHGTLYIDHERQLKLYLRAFWELVVDFRPYSLAFDILRKPRPHLDKLGFHLPDVYDDLDGVKGIDRYRAMVSHMVAHKLWSQPYLADNFSSFQHLTVETFEDARVETLAIRRYPGLRKLWLALHPFPKEGACPEGYACIRHKLAMLSRAFLDPGHPYTDSVLLEYVEKFHKRMADDPYNTAISTELGVAYLTKIYEHDFRKPKVWFEDTEISYRDDNRYLWMFLEDAEDEDDFHSDHGASDHKKDEQQEGEVLPPQHYPEWDYQIQSYRPDWTTVYEGIQSPGDPSHIDRLLEKHQLLAKRLKKVVDLLKPQQRKRVRYQEEGDELDLDMLIRAMTDFRAGSVPDTRIHQSHVKDGRDIAVLLLLDLSESINEPAEGGDTTILQLSQESVSMLAWAVEALGDPFAIAGFSSNTRHEVRYTHFKGFKEHWGDQPKSRLAAMKASYSTRMGSALRHAGRYLEQRREEKKLLLVLSDGEPSDIDVQDARYLKDDTHIAVNELEGKGIITYCITLDPNADEYVADIFGATHYTVIDRLERLPEKLPRLFMALTR
ncbi:von Willebrand factor A [Candidatus Thiomargarita nelsonii]|uniref:von Willebrand factor A n=1 Tax=Candidatus Thiomargarita nelsonii TaxID=1003181 RepID=A0A0A6PG52_9GAMM|nr:von Willebrand factor A [Candidatus Thiomargarita nelsonii]